MPMMILIRCCGCDREVKVEKTDLGSPLKAIENWVAIKPLMAASFALPLMGALPGESVSDALCNECTEGLPLKAREKLGVLIARFEEQSKNARSYIAGGPPFGKPPRGL